MNKKLKSISMIKYFPQKIGSSEIENKIGILKGWSEKYSGVKSKDSETSTLCGGSALYDAIESEKKDDIIVLEGASSSFSIEGLILKN